MTRQFLLVLLVSSTNLLAQLNSVFDEQNPILTPDGTEMYFTVGNHPLNVSGKRDAGDIWMSQLLNGKWSVPTLVKGSINNGGYNAVLGFSGDGQDMFLYGHYSSSGGMGASQGISVSKRTPGGWSAPRNEVVPYFLNKSAAFGGHITSDKHIFVFSAESRDTYGNEDIYVSFQEDGRWTEPKNLGSVINSKLQELSPWLSADTKTIYFSTNSNQVFGSFDVFSAERLDDSWTSWGQLQNLGPSVNSEGRELFYHIYDGKAFFTSTHNSDGYGDIRQVNPYPAGLPDTTVNMVTKPSPEGKMKIEVKEIVGEKEKVRVFGKVVNASSSSQGIASLLVFNGATLVSVMSGQDGRYEVRLNPNHRYSMRIESVGYMGLFEKVDLTGQAGQSVEMNFKLQPVAVGISINLRSVLFKQSSSEMLPESFDELDMVFEFLKTNPSVEIELGGHTDNSGKASLNLKLSRQRVARVKNYLTERGIESSRIKGVGYGETRPIASNRTDGGRRVNRRVEFKVIKD